MTSAALSFRDVGITFPTRGPGLRTGSVAAISELSLDVGAGEILALIGASGSGKSLLAEAALGVLPPTAKMTGTVLFDGQELDESRWRRLRGRVISHVPQSVDNLDPLMPAGRFVRIGLPKRTAREEQRALFDRYGLSPETSTRYPFQLSGGMLRRVLLASSMRGDIRLVIADEPTPGLHPQAVHDVLAHLREIADAGAAVLLITHDIGAAIDVAHRVAVLDEGRLLSVEDARDFVGDGSSLRHPFARALWRALPQNDFDTAVSR